MGVERRGALSGRAAPAPVSLGLSEEADGLGVLSPQEVLGLLLAVEHHAVILAAEARLLVSAECGMCGVQVVAVHPDAPALDRAPRAVGRVGVTRPHAGAEAVERV